MNIFSCAPILVVPKHYGSTQMETKHYLTDKEIAHEMGISRASVWRWVANGNLPQPTRIGPRTVRWPAAAIVEHFSSKEMQSGK